MSENKPKRRYAIPGAKRRGVYLEDDLWQRAKLIGDGNASEGIRRLLENSKKSKAEPDAPRPQEPTGKQITHFG